MVLLKCKQEKIIDIVGGRTCYLVREDAKSFSLLEGLTLNKLETLSFVYYVFGICKWPIYHCIVFVSILPISSSPTTWQLVKH